MEKYNLDSVVRRSRTNNCWYNFREAAVLDNKEVIQTQSYGPEARGGASKAEVIFQMMRFLP